MVEVLAHDDTGTGPPVVLLHGLTCHLGYWRRVTPHLGGLRVAALDFRGHGLSAHAGSYRYADYEEDLLTLLDTLGFESAPVAGHSLVAYNAMPEPRRVAALGDCALGCNVLGTPEDLVGSVEAVVPVDLRIPGCPPTPDVIAEALLGLIDGSSPR